MSAITGMIFLGAGMALGVGITWTLTPPPAQMRPSPVGAAEVSDLLERLKPLAKEPNGAWYNSGVRLEFYGSGVTLTLKMANGNEYIGRAPTLKGAVARLTEPSSDIQAAMKGWSEP